MTIHKSMGKQFDAVIVVRESVRQGTQEYRSSLVWRGDEVPYDRSRKFSALVSPVPGATFWCLSPFSRDARSCLITECDDSVRVVDNLLRTRMLISM